MIGNDISTRLPIHQFTTAIRWANKLLKEWITQNVGKFAEEAFLERGRHTQQLNVLIRKFNEARTCVTETKGPVAISVPIPFSLPLQELEVQEDIIYKMLMLALEPTGEAPGQPLLTSAMGTTLQFGVAYDYSPNESVKLSINSEQIRILDEIIKCLTLHEKRVIANGFALHLYCGEITDQDLNMPANINFENALKQVSHYIINSLQSPQTLSRADFQALAKFFNNMKYLVDVLRPQILQMNLVKLQQLFVILKMQRIVIETASAQVAGAANINIKCQMFFGNVIPTLSHLLMEYCIVAESFVSQAKSDLDLLQAEYCLENARTLALALFKKVEAFEGAKTLKKDVMILIISIEAKLACKNGDFELMDEKIENILSYKSNTIVAAEALALAASAYVDRNIGIANKHLSKANSIVKDILFNDLYLRKERLLPLEKKIVEIKKCIIQKQNKQLIESLKMKFPKLKIKPHSESGLIMFYPLCTIEADAVERCNSLKFDYLKITRVYHNDVHNGKCFNGIQMLTYADNAEGIAKDIRILLTKLNATSHKNSLPLLEKAIATMTISEESEDRSKPTRIPVLIEQAEAPYQMMPLAIKEKTHKAPAPTVAVAAPVSIAMSVCHAADFGFTLPGNPLVTPIYCSEAAQRQRRAKLFVIFKGIRGVEESVERQFAQMLNPTPEGLLTVGSVNQAGVKLWRHPDVLGDAWNLCALRFKRKGAAGWLRAVTEPEAKVTVVNKDGKAENHYLFTLGKPKHK